MDPLNIPTPKTPEELLALLNRAHAEMDKISGHLDAAFPGLADLPRIDLSGLTLDQKMALGDKACEDLTKLAYSISPITVLDRLEQKLPEDTTSDDASQALLSKLRNPK